MNPAEIYEKHPHADAYKVDGFYSPYCLVSREKRFSDAELAAEYWSQSLAGCIHPVDSFRGYTGVEVRGPSSARIDTLRRFATLPHYDEADQ